MKSPFEMNSICKVSLVYTFIMNNDIFTSSADTFNGYSNFNSMTILFGVKREQFQVKLRLSTGV